MSKSLGDFIQDRTESIDAEMITEYFIEKDKDKTARMLDTEQYLVEGSRGVGKTMLMRNAEITAREEFEKNSILAVWISFEESIRLERIRISSKQGIDPFLQWTMGKILIEVLKKLIQLKPAYSEQITDRLTSLFGTSNVTPQYITYIKLLDEYIEALERANIDNNEEIKEIAPSEKIVQILDNAITFKNFLLKLIDDFHLTRMVLLFDEAAHVFSEEQQIKFFTFFKSLRNNKIACKAAVYPGITNYGKYFEKNQDAKELKLSWSIYEPKDIRYIKDILKKRVQKYDPNVWNRLTAKDEIIKMICYSSNGNPRFAFHISDAMQSNSLLDKTNITQNQMIACLRSVNDEKWKDFDTLKQRMLRYSEYITFSEKIVKEEIFPNLRKWNDKRRKEKKKLSAGFYIEELTYKKISKVFDVLSYANILLVDDVKRSIGHGKYGYYVAINPSFLFSELIIKDVQEIGNTSNNIDNNQVYSEANKSIFYIVENVTEHQEFQCSNDECDFTTNDETFTFCKKCGSKMVKKQGIPLYKILRGHGVENLNLSTKIIERIRSKFSTVGEIYDAELDELRMKYIQDVRIEKIKNAAIEYMAG